MGRVVVAPMPERYRKISRLYRPRPGPIFRDFGQDEPSEQDRELAKALFKILDDQSKRWYLETLSDLFGNL